MYSTETSIYGHVNFHGGYTINPFARPFLLPGDSDRGVLLIHGFTSSPYYFRPLAEFLHLRGFTVSGMLLPGHGTTPDHLNRTHRRDWYVSVKRAFDSLNRRVRTVSVVGDSFGGILALILAAKHEDRNCIEKIITVGAPVKIPGDWFHKSLLPILKFLYPMHQKYWAQFLPDDQVMTEHGSYTAYPMHALEQMYLAIDKDCLPNLPLVNTPTLIVQGIQDSRVDPRSAKVLYRHLGATSKRIQWLTEFDHHPYLYSSPDFLDLLYDYLGEEISERQFHINFAQKTVFFNSWG